MDVRNLDKPKIAALIAQQNALRDDVARLALALVFHVGMTELVTISLTDKVAATNTLVTIYKAHRVSVYSSTTQLGAHKAADATNDVTAPIATNTATACTRANDLKVQANLHFVVSGSHVVADSTSSITAADATDDASLGTLLADIIEQLGTHFDGSFASEKITIVAA